MWWLGQHVQTQKGRTGEFIVQFLETRPVEGEIEWYLLHPLYSFDNKSLHNILETRAGRKMYTKHSMDFEMCSICLFCVWSELPKAPFLLTLCEVENHPLWPREGLRGRQDITRTEGSNQANSSFLPDLFTVTIWEVRLILFNPMENFRRPWFPWRSSLFGSKMPFTTPCERWHEPMNKLTFMWDKRGSVLSHEKTG